MTGSIVNRLMGNSAKAPEVGMGATILMFTDRHAATVIEVVTPQKIVIQRDEARRVDNNGMSESQEWEFKPNKNAVRETYTKRKNGAWVRAGDPMRNGTRLALGHRSEYYDFSF